MTLQELTVGDEAKVLSVNLPVERKERLRAIGVCADERICLLKVIGRKRIFIVQVCSSGVALALDRGTATEVGVWKK